MNDKPSLFTRSFAALSLAAAVALAILIALGSWQVKRLHWKEALIARVEAQIKGAPIPIADVLDASPALKGGKADPEYQPVTLSGTYDHTKELFYYTTLNGTIGWHIYTPLTIADPPGHTIFINRGFIPANFKEKSSRPESLDEGKIVITGLFRWPDAEKPNSFMPDNDVKENIFFWRDLDLMRETTGLDASRVLPFFVYAGKSEDRALPIGDVTIIRFPNNHLAYAMTWYGLGLTLIGVYGALLLGRVKSKI